MVPGSNTVASGIMIAARRVALQTVSLACLYLPSSSFFLRSFLSTTSHRTCRAEFSASPFSIDMESSPSQNPPIYWCKERNSFGNYGEVPIRKQAKIVCLASPEDPCNELLYADGTLPEGSIILTIATSIHDLQACERLGECNAVFCSHPQARESLSYLLKNSKSIEWIHTRSAGIDFVHSPTLAAWTGGIMTNAKGQFSSTLAEYSMGAMTYFAKDFGRLKRNQGAKQWDKYVRS